MQRRVTEYLVGLGTAEVPHTGTRFLSHLLAVARDLKEWGCPEHLQLAGAFQSLPGPQITATHVVPAGQITPQLPGGRALSGNASNVTVNIVEAGSLYNKRLHQFDLRIGKIFRFAGSRRFSANVDLFNVLNSSAVLSQSNQYASFATPQSVVGARFVKFSGSVSF